MINYQAGMIVRQKAIDVLPYIATIVDRINKVADTKNIEAFDEIILDAAREVEKCRKVTTVNELKARLQNELRWYKKAAKDIVVKKKGFRTGIGVRGKPIKKMTLKQYRSDINSWSHKRDERKKEIQRLVESIKALSHHGGKIVTRGGISFKMFIGGKYPAHLERSFKSGWKTIR